MEAMVISSEEAAEMELVAQVQQSKLEIRCKDHPNERLIEDYRTGSQVCGECGVVVGDRVIDPSAEWRSYNEQGGSDPSRVGCAENLLLDGGDLSTEIAGGHGEAAFDESGAPKYQQRRAVSNSDRIKMGAFKSISTMAGRLNIPKKTADLANQVFTEYMEKRGFGSGKGKTNDSTAAAALYIASRKEQEPRTFKEIVGVAKSSKKDISHAYKMILNELEDGIETIKTEDFISRFCSNLDLPKTVEKAATSIAVNAIRLDIAPGRSPISIIAAAIYMASQGSADKKTQKEISQVAGVADVTIRQAYKLMYSKAEVLFPKNFKFTTPIDQLPLS